MGSDVISVVRARLSPDTYLIRPKYYFLLTSSYYEVL